MNWKEIYNDRLMTAEEAVKKIKSKDRVVIGHAVGEPSYLAHPDFRDGLASEYEKRFKVI